MITTDHLIWFEYQWFDSGRPQPNFDSIRRKSIQHTHDTLGNQSAAYKLDWQKEVYHSS